MSWHVIGLYTHLAKIVLVEAARVEQCTRDGPMFFDCNARKRLALELMRDLRRANGMVEQGADEERKCLMDTRMLVWIRSW